MTSYRPPPRSEASAKSVARTAGMNSPDVPHLTALLTGRRGGWLGGRAAAAPTETPAVTAASSA
jgi:hypothetical protein